MNDYVLNKKPEPAANETVWAFDLGNVPRPADGRGWRAATGEGCDWPDEFPSPRWGEGGRSPDEVNKNLHHEFLHKASLPVPAEFAETKTAAGRRRMWRTHRKCAVDAFRALPRIQTIANSF
jgi:hypothetical protein